MNEAALLRTSSSPTQDQFLPTTVLESGEDTSEGLPLDGSSTEVSSEIPTRLELENLSSDVYESLDEPVEVQEESETTNPEQYLREDTTLADFEFVEPHDAPSLDTVEPEESVNTTPNPMKVSLRRSTRTRPPRESWNERPYSPPDFKTNSSQQPLSIVAENNQTSSSVNSSVALAQLLTAAISTSEPATFEQAINSQDKQHWLKAAREEYDSLMENQTWCLEDLPKNCKAIKGKWVFRRKYKQDGSVDRYKARFVVRGSDR